MGMFLANLSDATVEVMMASIAFVGGLRTHANAELGALVILRQFIL